MGAWSARRSNGREAVLVLSREAEPFRKCERAARTALEAEGWTVRTEVMNEKSPPACPADASLITVGTEAAVWSKAHAGAKVFCMVADVESAALGTGSAGVLAEIPAARQVALLRQALPEARSVGVLFKRGSARGERWVAALKQEAAKSGLTVDAEPVDSKENIASALDALIRRRVDVLWTMPDGALYDANTIKAVLHSTLEAKLPVFGFSTPVVKAGALVGVGITPDSQGAQAAALLLKRAKEAPGAPGQTVEPVYEVSVNQAVAERLGVRLPPSLAGERKGD